MDDYKVKLQVFEGPLDLLLHLVKINEMDIYDIPIAEVTRQYLEYLRLMETMDLEIAGEFLVMAATLLNIKLRSLLPQTSLDEEEDEEIGDILTAQALMDQLVQYRKFKEAASKLQEKEDQQARIFFREVALPQFANVEGDDLRSDLDKMLVAFSRVLRFVEAAGWHMVTEEEFSLEEKIDSIDRRIREEKRLDLETLFRECRAKVEMIVVLLALLELSRQKCVTLEQSDPYGPVYLFWRDPTLAPVAVEAKDAIPAEEIPAPSSQAFKIGAEEEGNEEDSEEASSSPSDVPSSQD